MDRYLLIYAPRLQPNEPFARLDARNESFLEALTSETHGVRLVHPRTRVATFPFWLRALGERTELVVRHAALQNAFESPEQNGCAMFLARPVQTDLRLSFQSAHYHYRRLSARELGLGSSLFWHDGFDGMRGRLLQEHRSAGAALEPWAIKVDDVEGPPDGWLNPIVLELDIRGSACDAAPTGAAANDTRRVLGALLEHGRLLAIVPAFDAESSARCLAWTRLLRSRAGRLSALERLVAGAAPALSCREAPAPHLWPFLALDALGGAFVLEGHGRGTSSASEAPLEARWCAPRALAANGRWLVRRLVSCWGDGAPLILPEQGHDDTAPHARVRDESCRFRLATNDQDPRAREPACVVGAAEVPRRPFARIPDHAGDVLHSLSSASAFATFCAERLPSAGVESTGVARYIAGLLTELEAHGLSMAPHAHEAWLQPTRTGLHADVPGFLDAMARRLVSPRSSVLIQLPPRGGLGQRCYLDPSRSVPHGHRAMLWGLLRTARVARRDRTLTTAMGWWNDWHASLFDDAADVRIDFTSTRFGLGRSRLGAAALGAERAHTSAAHVRFSVPS